MRNATGNKALVAQVAKSVREEMASSRKYSLKKLETIKWIADNVLPLLPPGVSLPSNSYRYDLDYLRLTIEADENRPWQGWDGTAGIIARTRKALGVTRFKRETSGESAEDFTTSFEGRGTIADREVYITLALPGQKPDQCRIIVEEVLETPEPRAPRIVKRIRTVCGPEEAVA